MARKRSASTKSEGSAKNTPKKTPRESTRSKKSAKKAKRNSLEAAVPKTVKTVAKANEPVIQPTKAKNTLFDLDIVRCNFCDWSSDAVHSMAFSGDMFKILAVARYGGSVEIYSTETFLQKLFVVPGKPLAAGSSDFVQVTAMQFVKERRLFISDLEGFVSEVCLEEQSLKHELNSNGGAIWDMKKIQPMGEKEQLIVASEDGFLRTFKIVDEDGDETLEFLNLVKVNHPGRVLCLALGVSNSKYIFTGGLDGTVRKIEFMQMRVIHTLELKKSDNNQDDRLVLSLMALSDGTVVAGDSLGCVTFFDSFGVVIGQFNQHEGSVLALETSQDENQIFSAGHDSSVAVFRRMDDNWHYSYFQKPHTHDLFSLQRIVLRGESHLVSGGTDTELALYKIEHLSDFKEFITKKTNPFAGIPSHVSISSKFHHPVSKADSFILLARNARSLDVIRIALPDNSVDGEIVKHSEHGKLVRERQDTPRVLAKMCFKGKATIIASDVSDCGKVFAAATSTELKIFALNLSIEKPNELLRPITNDLELVKSPPRLLKFFNISSKMMFLAVVDNLRKLHIFKIDSDKARISKVTEVDLPKQVNNDTVLPFTSLQISRNGEFIALLQGNSDITFAQMSFEKKSGFSVRFFPVSRKLHGFQKISSISIISGNVLQIISADNMIYQLDLETQKLTPWSESHFQTSSFPNLIKHSRPILGSGAIDDKSLFFYGTSFAGFIRTDLPLRLDGEKQTREEVLKPTASDRVGLRMTSEYSPVVSAKCIDDSRLVVVEAPWSKISESFPARLYKKTFGGNN